MYRQYNTTAKKIQKITNAGRDHHFILPGAAAVIIFKCNFNIQLVE
jgi:hypothetical protein